jgi:hypothetical protein
VKKKRGGITMKKISCIVIAALFAASAYSQSLRVSFNGNRDFQLKVDGKTYNSTNYSGSDVVVNNLSGDHDVSVYKINKRGRSKKLYSSAVSLSYGQEVHLTINKDGSISREETSSNAAYGYKSPMSSTDFNQVYRNVNTQWSQASKMSEARDVFNTSSYYFSADQARQIVGLISSEANRLELLKLAYDNITDQSNFYQLYDLLLSQASRDELDNYVRSYSYGDSYNSYKVVMNDYNFNRLYQNVVNQRNTSKKLSEAMAIQELITTIMLP